MKNALIASLFLLFSAAYASAQDDQGNVQPDSPAPTQIPSPPPENPPAPPAEVHNDNQDQNQAGEVVAAQTQQPPSSGQWVYTAQYGWVWMPYGSQYVYEPTYEGTYPYSYVYYPASGWIWVASPWVYGWGPWPYFGVYGPRFFWFSHPGFYGRFGYRFPHRAYRGWGNHYGGGWGRWGNGYQGGGSGGWHRGYQGGGFRGGGFHQMAAPGFHAGGGFHRSAPPGGHVGGFGRGGGRGGGGHRGR